ncbi:MAG TPA: hypothetical protein VFH42_05120 [Sporolactobacillaceae bacterium]|nr:hypothetical protein [Sporolactobacillaceae bacterium]
MKPKIRKIDYLLAFLTEYIALLIALFPILHVNGLFINHLFPTALMAVIMLLVHLWSGRLHPTIFIPATLISMGVAWLMGLSIDIAFVFGVLLLWRTFDVFKGDTFERLWIILAVTFGLSLIYSYGLPPFYVGLPDHRPIMLLLVIETLCIFITQLVFTGLRQKRDRGVLTRSYIVLFLSSLALLALIGKGLMTLFGHISLRPKNQHYSYSQHGGLPKTQPEIVQGTATDFHMPYWAIAIIGIVGLLIILLIIIGLVKWKWGSGYFQKGKQTKMLTGRVEKLEGHVEKPVRKRKRRAPKDPVRLELFRLERRLKTSPHGRHPFDTVHSWFQRLPINESDKATITSIYEKVRYGYKKITQSEWEGYQLAIQSAKVNLKNRGMKNE